MGGSEPATDSFSVGAGGPDCTAVDAAPTEGMLDVDESESNPPDEDEPEPDELGHRIDPIMPLPLQVIGLCGVVGAVVDGGGAVVDGGGAVVGVGVGVVVGVDAPGISAAPCCSMAAGL
jgi:hypothetical protein